MSIFKRKSFWHWAAIAVAVVFFFLVWRQSVISQANLNNLPFGGQITLTLPCVEGVLLTIGPPMAGRFLVSATSQVYDYQNLYTPGVWVLGTAMPGGTCDLFPVDGTVIQIGTSLSPGL